MEHSFKRPNLVLSSGIRCFVDIEKEFKFFFRWVIIELSDNLLLRHDGPFSCE